MWNDILDIFEGLGVPRVFGAWFVVAVGVCLLFVILGGTEDGRMQ